MKRTANVIVTAAGTPVGQGIIKCLKLANSKQDGIEYRITATDASPLAAGLYRGDSGVVVPLASDPSYVGTLVELARRTGTSAVFVGSDEELYPLSLAREKIEKESGAKVMVNPPSVLETCLDRWKTYVFLKENDFPRAETAVPEFRESFYGSTRFPLVVKSRTAQGPDDLHVVRDAAEADLAIELVERSGERPLIQEHLGGDGMEFTTGVTVSEDGSEVLSSIALKRTMKGGQTYKAFIDDFEEVRALAEKVALKLGARGAISVQSRLADGLHKVFGISPGISASSPMRAVAGVNEPDLLYRDSVLGERAKVTQYQRLVAMRYWDEVYVRQSTFEKTEKQHEFSGPDSVVLPYF